MPRFNNGGRYVTGSSFARSLYLFSTSSWTPAKQYCDPTDYMELLLISRAQRKKITKKNDKQQKITTSLYIRSESYIEGPNLHISLQNPSMYRTGRAKRTLCGSAHKHNWLAFLQTKNCKIHKTNVCVWLRLWFSCSWGNFWWKIWLESNYKGWPGG